MNEDRPVMSATKL